MRYRGISLTRNPGKYQTAAEKPEGRAVLRQDFDGGRRCRGWGSVLQGYLAHKKQRPPRTVLHLFFDAGRRCREWGLPLLY